jgi:hypothetical protein
MRQALDSEMGSAIVDSDEQSCRLLLTLFDVLVCLAVGIGVLRRAFARLSVLGDILCVFSGCLWRCGVLSTHFHAGRLQSGVVEEGKNDRLLQLKRIALQVSNLQLPYISNFQAHTPTRWWTYEKLKQHCE